MAQFGSNEKPVLLTSKKNKGRLFTKGSKPRPGVYSQQYKDNFDKIFGKKKDEKSNARRRSFKARHAKNIKKGKMSAAYWANKVKW